MASLKNLLVLGSARFVNTIKGTIEKAEKLLTARTIQTDLTSTSSASFDGSANITPGVTGVLPIANGGTNANSAADARTNLGLGSAATASTASAVGNNSNLPTGAAVQTYVTGLGYTSNTGTVTKVSTGTGLTGGDITTTGTISLASGVVSAGSAGPTAAVTGTEGTTIAVPRITVDTYGRVTGLTSYNLTNKDTTYTAATTSADGLMSSTDKTKLDGVKGQNTWYGTCATAASTAAKVVTTTSEDFVLATGSMVRVKFTNNDTYNGTSTLNVDGTGAKNIARVGTSAKARYYWLAGEVVDFVYDGTYYTMLEGGVATTTYYGITKLSSATDSTSTGLAATASAVKAAYDLASGKQDPISGADGVDVTNNVVSLTTEVQDIIDSVKELPFVTPEMFGAVGDGSTNDTQAIQAAITEVSTTGGTVYFLPKTYVVDSVSITTHNVSLRGTKASTTGRGTILIAASTNTGPMINVTTSSGMLIGGGIYDMALMANNARQRYTDAKEKVGINILNRAEFILQNVYVSGFKNGGVYAKDWWDSDVIGLEIRACGIADTKPALYLGSEDDSSNSLHFFGLHIEESPYQLAIEGLCSNVQFVASKFEGGAQIGEPNKGTHWIYIYEGVYAVTFTSCFFSDNAADTVWLDIRNNLTALFGCQFSMGYGTLIKNYSANQNYGKNIIISNCSFDRFGKSEAPIYLNYGAILANNIFDCQDFANSIYVNGNFNVIQGNSFYSGSAKYTPLFSVNGTDNKFVGNRYQGVQALWTGAKGNQYDNKKEVFYTRTSTDQLASINFAAVEVPNIFWNSSTAVTLTSSNFANVPNDAEITFFSGGGTLTFDTTIVQGGTTCEGGKSLHLKYVATLSKFIKV